ncbi:MAG: extradiol ring-cleavage dioxygenase [Sphingomonas sp.]|uniref:DODA-type extradiol aromatic ring-opening family dioxygenase n=1 Tax=Sphingomonas sp. TaxID=28214 RepID=UPI001AD0AFF0|nr:extradiol ring-cleavage dioxygenase [Sphingomonas sp.]MBN8814338.1 extradiol ring-cleavage dioxygenase [Sphingomonas sp.]
MAKIVYGAGTSHTPVLTLPPEHWHERAKADINNPKLTLTDGRTLDYRALHAEVGDKYADQVTVDVFAEKGVRCQAALDRLADDLERANPDVVLIVGDDQDELFGTDNLPVISIYFGDELVMHSEHDDGSIPAWRVPVREGFAMDDFHRFPGHSALALDIIAGLLDRDVDIGSSARVSNPAEAGFGHAYGFVIKRLFKGRAIPVVPVLLNTYFPPNVASAKRCFDIGRFMREAIEQSPADLRVAVIASGGLSHFVVDEELDRRILTGLRDNDADMLRSIPRAALRSGSSEILNWIVAAGAINGMQVAWEEYVPLYRTPAGTGIGAAFMSFCP